MSRTAYGVVEKCVVLSESVFRLTCMGHNS